METITIPLEEYKDLQDAWKWLQALEDAGVDNWSGYEFALELYNQDSDE